jgi:hypothetical protein
VAVEIRLLDHWLLAFKRIEGSVKLNLDPTTIFRSTNVVEKSNLMMSVKNNLYEVTGSGSNSPMPPQPIMRPTFTIGPRPRYDLRISEGFLLGPLISLSTWPLPWDPTFSPMDAVQLDRYLNSVRIAGVSRPLFERQIPTNSLGDSKRLHYLTKRGSQWLIEAVKKGLQDIGIEHAEHCYEPSIVCCLNQQRHGLSFSEGVEICFRKLPFRDVYGVKVTDVRWATRKIGAAAQGVGNTNDFINIVKGILERAEADAEIPKPMHNVQLDRTNVHPMPPHAPPLGKRPTYG